MRKPNIVFILADDMGYGDVGCFGATKIPTPSMDRLAAEGIRFTDCHSSSAVCTPSRYSIVTGRYCWRSSLKRWVLGGFGAPIIEPARATVASMLKDDGYATAAIGKWHLGFDWVRKDGGGTVEDFGAPAWSLDGFEVDFSKPLKGGPTALGFDYYFGISGSLDMPPYCFIENDFTVGIPSREKDPYFNQQREGTMTDGWRDDEVDTTFAERANTFIETRATTNPDQPFFLYLATASPHRPCDVRPDFVKGKSQAGDRGDMVCLFDWVVGQVAGTLKRLGIADQTLLVVTSDNGARLTCADGQDHGHKSCGEWRGQKADIWDGGHREPFIARWPGHITPGSTCDEPVCLVDFMATCADAARVDLPDAAAEDSFTMLPLLLAQSPEHPMRDTIIHHSGDGMFAIRRGKWKLIRGLGSGGFTEPKHLDPEPGGPEGQLYDLDTDPGETMNLWQERPEVVAELSAYLQDCIDAGRSRPEVGPV
jgi:arylsulfatase A